MILRIWQECFYTTLRSNCNSFQAEEGSLAAADEVGEGDNSGVARNSNGATPSVAKSVKENDASEAMIPRPSSTYLEEEEVHKVNKKH